MLYPLSVDAIYVRKFLPLCHVKFYCIWHKKHASSRTIYSHGTIYNIYRLNYKVGLYEYSDHQVWRYCYVTWCNFFVRFVDAECDNTVKENWNPSKMLFNAISEPRLSMILIKFICFSTKPCVLFYMHNNWY